MVNVAIFYGFLLALVIYASACGGEPERLAAAILSVSAATDTALVHITSGLFESWVPTLFTLDMITFGAITIIAIKAERRWPMVMAGFLLVGVELQIGIWAAPVMHRRIYKLAHAYSAYPVMLILLIGVYRHAQRSRVRPERDWTVFARSA